MPNRIRILIPAFLLCGLCLNIAAREVGVYPQLGHNVEVFSVVFSPDVVAIAAFSRYNAVTG